MCDRPSGRMPTVRVRRFPRALRRENSTSVKLRSRCFVRTNNNATAMLMNGRRVVRAARRNDSRAIEHCRTCTSPSLPYLCVRLVTRHPRTKKKTSAGFLTSIIRLVLRFCAAPPRSRVVRMRTRGEGGRQASNFGRTTRRTRVQFNFERPCIRFASTHTVDHELCNIKG